MLVSHIRLNNLHKNSEQKAIKNLLNVHEIKLTPSQQYMESYEKHSKFIKRELFTMGTQLDQNLLLSQFFEILSKKSQSLVKSVINKVDDIFCEAVLDDEEKTEFGNA